MRIESGLHNKTVAADLAIVTILASARIRANASRTLGRQAAEPDVSPHQNAVVCVREFIDGDEVGYATQKMRIPI